MAVDILPCLSASRSFVIESFSGKSCLCYPFWPSVPLLLRKVRPARLSGRPFILSCARQIYIRSLVSSQCLCIAASFHAFLTPCRWAFGMANDKFLREPISRFKITLWDVIYNLNIMIWYWDATSKVQWCGASRVERISREATFGLPPPCVNVVIQEGHLVYPHCFS